MRHLSQSSSAHTSPCPIGPVAFCPFAHCTHVVRGQGLMGQGLLQTFPLIIIILNSCLVSAGLGRPAWENTVPLARVWGNADSGHSQLPSILLQSHCGAPVRCGHRAGLKGRQRNMRSFLRELAISWGDRQAEESYSSVESAVRETSTLGDLEERSYESGGGVKAKQVPNVILVKCMMSQLSARSLVLIHQWISNCGPWKEGLTPTMYQELSEPWGYRVNKIELEWGTSQKHAPRLPICYVTWGNQHPLRLKVKLSHL